MNREGSETSLANAANEDQLRNPVIVTPHRNAITARCFTNIAKARGLRADDRDFYGKWDSGAVSPTLEDARCLSPPSPPRTLNKRGRDQRQRRYVSADNPGDPLELTQ